MNEEATGKPAVPRQRRVGGIALVAALLALAGTTAQWFGVGGQRTALRGESEAFARTQRRLNTLEDRLQRERDDLGRLAARVGTDDAAEDSVAGRVARLETAVGKLPGSSQSQFLWLLDQAEYFMRIANAQESLAGDSTGALTALALADKHLQDANDPRVAPVRKLVAAEMAALRAVPRVDTEGLVLKLGTLAGQLGSLPPRGAAPTAFHRDMAPAEAPSGSIDRALQSMRNAFFSIVSVRRTDIPAETLLPEDSSQLVIRSLELELQLARLALLRGEIPVFRASLASVRRGLENYFDSGAPAVAGALATLDEVATVRLPESLPDISASLTELLRVKERAARP